MKCTYAVFQALRIFGSGDVISVSPEGIRVQHFSLSKSFQNKQQIHMV